MRTRSGILAIRASPRRYRETYKPEGNSEGSKDRELDQPADDVEQGPCQKQILRRLPETSYFHDLAV